MVATLLLVIVLLALVAAFAVQNSGDLTVHFLHLSRVTSLPVIVVIALGAGVLVGLLCFVPASLRRRRTVRELTAELAALRKPSAPPPPETM